MPGWSRATGRPAYRFCGAATPGWLRGCGRGGGGARLTGWGCGAGPPRMLLRLGANDRRLRRPLRRWGDAGLPAPCCFREGRWSFSPSRRSSILATGGARFRFWGGPVRRRRRGRRGWRRGWLPRPRAPGRARRQPGTGSRAGGYRGGGKGRMEGGGGYGWLRPLLGGRRAPGGGALWLCARAQRREGGGSEPPARAATAVGGGWGQSPAGWCPPRAGGGRSRGGGSGAGRGGWVGWVLVEGARTTVVKGPCSVRSGGGGIGPPSFAPGACTPGSC